MTNHAVVPIRSDVLRVYVVYTRPSGLIDLNKDLDKRAIETELAAGYCTGQFADERLTTLTLLEINNTQVLRENRELDWYYLTIGYFGSVWFYGGGLSDYTVEVFLKARARRLRIVDWCRSSSIFSRYSRQWFFRPHLWKARG